MLIPIACPDVGPDSDADDNKNNNSYNDNNNLMDVDAAVSDRFPSTDFDDDDNDNNVMGVSNEAIAVPRVKREWTREEEIAFVEGFETHGRDWMAVAKVGKT